MSSSPQATRFLLVEDEQAHADLVRMMLEANNVTHAVDHVSDGEAALAFLRREGPYAAAARPDLILLDLHLPKRDGHEVLEEIKTDPDLASIPVLILTTSANERDVRRAYAGHANSYLTKPLDFAQFQQMIADIGTYWTVWNKPSLGQASGEDAAA